MIILRLLCFLVLSLVTATSTAATVPPGWSIKNENGIQIYRTDDDMVEVRISAHRLLQPADPETILAGLVSHVDRLVFPWAGLNTLNFLRAELNTLDDETRPAAYFDAASWRHKDIHLEVIVEDHKRVLFVYVSKRVLSEKARNEVNEIIDSVSVVALATSIKRKKSTRRSTAFRIPFSSILGPTLCDRWAFICSGSGVPFSAVQGFGRKDGDVWLMLRDGTAYRNPEVAPEDFDVVRSRIEEPERWIQWQDNPRFEGVFPLPGYPREHAYPIVGEFSISTPPHMIVSQPTLLEPAPDLGKYFAPTLPIKFKGDGTFESIVVEKEGAAAVPRVSGKHAVRGYTLELIYDDGTIQRVPYSAIRNNPIVGSRIF